jgi:hypothetical protein
LAKIRNQTFVDWKTLPHVDAGRTGIVQSEALSPHGNVGGRDCPLDAIPPTFPSTFDAHSISLWKNGVVTLDGQFHIIPVRIQPEDRA